MARDASKQLRITPGNRPRIRLFMCALGAVAGIALLRIFIPAGAPPEYDYTARQIFRFSFGPLLLVAFWLSPLRLSRAAKIFFSAAGVLLAIPLMSPSVLLLPWRLGYVLSFSWVTGSLCAGLGFFLAAPGRGNVLAGIFCVLGSLCLAFSLGELWLLCTSQAQDAIVNDTAHSKYISRDNTRSYGDNIRSGPRGDFPAGAGSPYFEASRLLKHDETLFDVLYGFDDQGRRAVPAADAHPQFELMLFGCSFTFGVGLEDRQTWAWKLAELLGPEWRLENYAYAGFGPQQMLSLLEDGAVEEPAAPRRAALYFAIEDQLRRNAGLVYKPSIHYSLQPNGALKRDGMTTDTFNAAICVLPKYLNGSQLARYVSLGAVLYLAKRDHMEMESAFVEIIKESAAILLKKYDAPLTILLWPDVEYLAPRLRALNLPVLLAREWLPGWDATNGRDYLIHPKWEWHPNARATDAIAKGLATYFRAFFAQEKGAN